MKTDEDNPKVTISDGERTVKTSLNDMDKLVEGMAKPEQLVLDGMAVDRQANVLRKCELDGLHGLNKGDHVRIDARAVVVGVHNDDVTTELGVEAVRTAVLKLVTGQVVETI